MRDDPPIPLHRDLVAAVRQILVGYGVFVQERVGPDRGLDFVHDREGQRGDVRMPVPRPCEVPRILATGVSILRPPLFATLPAVKLKAPWLRLKRAEFEVPFESQTNSFSAIWALFERLNAVPSVKVMPTAPSAPVSIVSCRQTESPALT